MESDEEQIRDLLERWADATRHERRGEVLANRAEGTLLFDVLPPSIHEGTAAYRSTWDGGQPEFDLPALFELEQLSIASGDRAAFAHRVIRCGGVLKSGRKIEDLVRATFCFEKEHDRRRIVHQHISMPAEPKGA